jgi:hypothetical protein
MFCSGEQIMAKKLIKILFMLGNYTYHLGPGEKDAPPHQ